MSEQFRAGCEDYTRAFKTRAQAERWVAEVERFGQCPLPHTVSTVDGAKACRHCGAPIALVGALWAGTGGELNNLCCPVNPDSDTHEPQEALS